MITNNKIIELNYLKLKCIANNICNHHQHKDDFFQEMLLILLNIDNELINNLNNNQQLIFYFTKICKNNWNSTTSMFYRKYIKQSKYITNIEDYERYKH